MSKRLIYAEDAITVLQHCYCGIEVKRKRPVTENERFFYFDVLQGLEDLPSAQPQLEICPIYGGMCGYPSNLCYECPRHGGAHEKPLWWTAGLQPFAQPKRTEERTETRACDSIGRQDAIDALKSLEFRQYMEFGEYIGEDIREVCLIRAEKAQDALQSLPSAQPEWIPVSEDTPKKRDWYLGIFKEPDTGWINPLPFICDYVGRETKATTKEGWILRGYTEREEHIDYYFNLECVAWMPLPGPYKGEQE